MTCAGVDYGPGTIVSLVKDRGLFISPLARRTSPRRRRPRVAIRLANSSFPALSLGRGEGDLPLGGHARPLG